MNNEDKYPLLYTRGVIVYPFQEVTIDVGRESSIELLDYAFENKIDIVVTSQKDIKEDNPTIDNHFDYGTLCSIKRFIKRNGYCKLTLYGGTRVQITNVSVENNMRHAECIYQKSIGQNDIETEALTKKAISEFNSIASKYGRPGFPLSTINDFDYQVASSLVDTFAQIYVQNLNEKVKFLETLDVNKRLILMLEYIIKEKNLEAVEKEINSKVSSNMDKTQKEYFLREKLKVIKNELGDTGDLSDISDLKEKLAKNPYPEHVVKKAEEEIRKFEMVPPGSSEASVIRTYLETLLGIPWFEKSVDNNDLKNAKKILDEDHYGLDKVKERILEYLAVKQMTNSLKSPIICLIGPPGVGKTSLATSIARALNRKFVKVSLGGVRDEAEIRGHRKTYIGSMPGRIINGIKRAGTINPVFLIDELDKMSNDYKGDPASAMLEVLDPEQNKEFSDHYLEEPYDLSDVMFIATANYVENIPSALYDRLEIINLSSYTEIDKLNIAKEHLIRKQLEANGLIDTQIKLDDNTILYLIRHYTREAGVRQLERVIGSLCRKTVLAILKDKKKSVTITKPLINKWLGHEIFDYGTKEKKNQIGVVTGLAYTSFGGDILPIEVNYFDGKGKLVVTGQLGDVMKESAEIALDYVKANAKKYGIDPKFFEKHDIHIHVPEGAVPKDGPSAGITLTTALISSLSSRPVDASLAMTGEVTLRGNVLPIGGLKEKSLAAHRSGIKRIIIPKGNVKDMDEIPDIVKKTIKFIPVEKVDQVVKQAFGK